MALKIIDYGTKEYQQMVDLRNDILRKPLGMVLEAVDIEADEEHILIGAFEDEKMLGCCMLVRNEDNVLLRQMAVRNQLQGKGIGRALMEFAETIARDIGYKEIAMHARSSSAGFYERLGYAISGDEFEKLSIAHVLMKKRI
ncbi:GNAT family N-acetyltransferase [Niabella aquatica]